MLGSYAKPACGLSVATMLSWFGSVVVCGTWLMLVNFGLSLASASSKVSPTTAGSFTLPLE